MQLALTNSPLNISNVGPRLRSTNVATATIRSTMTLAVLSVLLLSATRPAHAQGEAVLYSFNGNPDGANPESSLTLSGGNFYGTTHSGGTGSSGTVFELSPDGNGGYTETVLYNFCSLANCADGANPTYGTAIFDSQGNLYGTAYAGGANSSSNCGNSGCGVVYELSPGQSGWTETVLYNFCSAAQCTDGANPVNGLVMDKAGRLYGTTYSGGSGGNGSVFQLAQSGGVWKEKVIYNIRSTYAGLTMDAQGHLYGTTYRAVFELIRNSKGIWNPTTIYTFPKPSNPNGTPVVDSAGNLYGTTFAGGQKSDGTVYKLSPGAGGKWTEQNLLVFGSDSSHPLAGVALDSAGNLFGTTSQGGRFGAGTIFELQSLGNGTYKYRVLMAFTGENGNQAYGNMIVDGGDVYGTTFFGGTSGNGTVFAVNPNAAVTTTTLTSTPNPSTQGETVTFTATVTPAPPDGELITFEMIGQAPLVGGQAVFQTSTLPKGKTKVRAIYFGDLNFYSSRSIWHYQAVQ